MGRFVLAVIAGLVFWTLLWMAAGQVVKVVNPDAFGEDGMTVTSNAIFVLFVMVAALACIVSGWLAALIARDRGRMAAVAVAFVLLAMGLGVEISGWDAAPVWYRLAFLGLLVPATLGGALLKR